jgi:hypothetical protein
MTLYTGDLAITKVPHNEVCVSTNGDDTTGDGTYVNPYKTIAYALSSITDASSTKPYVIKVGAGVFVEVELTCKAYVTIAGSTTGTTLVEPDAIDHKVINLVANSALNFLTIQGAGAGFAGVDASNCGDFALLHKVSIYDCDTCVYFEASSINSKLYLEYVEFNGEYVEGLVVKSNGFSAFSILDNFYTSPETTSATSQVRVDGSTAAVKVIASSISGKGTGDGLLVTNGANLRIHTVSFTNTSNLGTAIRLTNDAKLVATACACSGFNKGIHIENVGAASTIYGDFNLVDNVTNDIQIDHPTAVGNITGIAQFSKVVNAATSTMSLTYTDPVVGDYNVRRIIHTRGFATDIKELVSSATTTVLTNTDPHVAVITGNTSGQIVQLPNATTLRRGHQLWIINASTVTMITQQFGGSNSITLYSSGSVRYILRDNTTPLGIWNRSISSSAPFQGTSPIICGYGGNAGTGRYLEYVAGNASDASPFIIISPSTLVGLSIANGGGSTTATVGLFEVTNLITPIATIGLIAQPSAYTSTLSVNLAAGSKIAVRIISGSMLKPFVCYYIAGQ